ncbi:hypothetical protein SLS62_007861 [Diatrype stigma]|uniref:Uncharacterized protein n=1 Tax=Diatrype stigma TaxID=117547 RepID=A0AAN9YN44_9PEZI
MDAVSFHKSLYLVDRVPDVTRCETSNATSASIAGRDEEPAKISQFGEWAIRTIQTAYSEWTKSAIQDVPALTGDLLVSCRADEMEEANRSGVWPQLIIKLYWQGSEDLMPELHTEMHAALWGAFKTRGRHPERPKRLALATFCGNDRTHSKIDVDDVLQEDVAGWVLDFSHAENQESALKGPGSYWKVVLA